MTISLDPYVFDLDAYGFTLLDALHDDIATRYLLPGDFVKVHISDEVTGDAEAVWAVIVYTEPGPGMTRTYEVTLTESPLFLPFEYGSALTISSAHVLDWTEEPASATT